MELPITRPSRISYADELDFSELLGELKSKRYNGFIRVTSGHSEGYILFKEGKQVAASYDNYSKVEAIEKIKSATNDGSTVVEVFDLRESQIDYLMNINKSYVIDSGSGVNDIIDELKKNESPVKTEIKQPSDEPGESEIKQSSDESEESTIKETVKVESEISNTPEKEKSENTESVKEKLQAIAEARTESKPDKEIQQETEVITEPNNISHEIKAEKTEESELKSNTEEKETNTSTTKINEEEIESKEPPVETETVDRAELMKKYGLKDVREEEVDDILDTYKGGSLSDEDVEKIELTLMNKVKKSILGIPKIRGTEVMVFLENASELTGTINIITEYESKGFLSRIMGESGDLDNLKQQIVNITQIEIKKSFRGYPEIVDDFQINVEVS